MQCVLHLVEDVFQLSQMASAVTAVTATATVSKSYPKSAVRIVVELAAAGMSRFVLFHLLCQVFSVVQ